MSYMCLPPRRACTRLRHMHYSVVPILSCATCRDYNNWREEGGKLPDGRHYKNFFLVEECTRVEKLVITAEDSHRRDRCGLLKLLCLGLHLT
jgi:hypothetical protein